MKKLPSVGEIKRLRAEIRRLKRKLKEAPVLYGASGDGPPVTWYDATPGLYAITHKPTHRARLLNVKKLQAKERP